MGRERVGMYTMDATHSLNDLCVRNNFANRRGAELRTTQKGAAITEKVHVPIYIRVGRKVCMQCVAVKYASNLQQHVGDYDNCEFCMSNVTVFDFNCEGSRGELCF